MIRAYNLSCSGMPKALFTLAVRTAQGQVAYRAAVAISLLSNALAFVVLVSVWRAALGHSGGRAGFSQEQLIAYVAFSFIINFSVSVMADARFGSRILSGVVLFDLVRPMGCMWMQLGQAFGAFLGKLLPLTVMIAVALGALGTIALPASFTNLLLSVLSLLLAFMVNFGIEYLAAQLLFMTTHFYGVVAARMAVHAVFSGLYAPLAFFPDYIQKVAYVMPFRHVIETPLLIYWDRAGPDSGLSLLGQQLAWAMALLVVAHLLLSRFLRRLTINGEGGQR